jgi:hypothetical protein
MDTPFVLRIQDESNPDAKAEAIDKTGAVNLKFLSYCGESSWEFQIQKPH